MDMRHVFQSFNVEPPFWDSTLASFIYVGELIYS